MIAKIDGKYFEVVIVDAKIGEVKLGKELITNNSEEADKHSLHSFFKTKEGKDYPFPRYLDGDFTKFGFYKPLVTKS